MKDEKNWSYMGEEFHIYWNIGQNFILTVVNKKAVNSIREQLNFENKYIREFVHIWKTNQKPLQYSQLCK